MIKKIGGFGCAICGRITYDPKHSMQSPMCKECYVAWMAAKNKGYEYVHSSDCSGTPMRRL